MTNKRISKQLTIGLFLGIFILVSSLVLVNSSQLKQSDDLDIDELSKVEYGNFMNVAIQGNVRVNFKSSDTTIIAVNEKLIKQGKLKIHNNGETLYIKSYIKSHQKKNRPSVIIQSNKISHVQINNGAKAFLYDYKADMFRISADNANIEINNLQISYGLIQLFNESQLTGGPILIDTLELHMTNKSHLWCNDLQVKKIVGGLLTNSQISYHGKSQKLNLVLDETSRINKY